MNTRKRLPEGAVILLALVVAGLVSLVLLLLLLTLTGCTGTEQKQEANKTDDRHRLDVMDVGISRYIVYRDNITGVYYVGAVDGGICVMVNADGTPYTGE